MEKEVALSATALLREHVLSLTLILEDGIFSRGHGLCPEVSGLSNRPTAQGPQRLLRYVSLLHMELQKIETKMPLQDPRSPTAFLME